MVLPSTAATAMRMRPCCDEEIANDTPDELQHSYRNSTHYPLIHPARPLHDTQADIVAMHGRLKPNRRAAASTSGCG